MGGHIIGFLFCCFLAASVQAGSFTDSLFTRGADTAQCVVDSGLSLDIHYRDAMRMEYGPVRPFHSATPKTPDVAIMKNNHFRFFWSDSQSITSGPKLYRMDALISDTGITIQDTVSVSGRQTLFQRPVYLHADAVDTFFFVSVVEKNIFRGYSNRPTVRLDSIGGGSLSIFDGSQCHYKDNVFLAVYEQSTSRIACRKIFITTGVPSQSAQEYVIADNQNHCCNPSIAADSTGNVLALWMQGTKASVKQLSYAFYDSTFTFHDSATFPENIDDAGMLNSYDDAPVVSYGRGKFASVNWDPAGIVLRLFEIRPAVPLDTMAITGLRVTAQSNCRFPALAVNNRYLAIAWTERPAQNTVYLKAVRYNLQNGVIDTAKKDTIADTAINNTVEANDTIAFNCAMDSSGSMGLCWQMNHSAQAGVLSSRNIFYDSGSWTSAPVLIQAGLRDSVCFDSGAIIASRLPQGCSFQGFLGVSPDSSPAANFFAIDNGAALRNATKGLFKYFQYRISLKPSVNLLKTPVVRKAFLQWNAKPRIDTLGTVTINQTPLSNVGFGDTVTCRARVDSVTCRFSLSDADSSDTLFPEIAWLSSTRSDTLSGFLDRSSSMCIAPIFQSDTLVACRFTAHDVRNWAAQDSVLFIKTRNVVPSLRVRAVLNASPSDTTTIAALSTINVKQSDSIEFFYSLSDSNDPAVKSYMSINGGLIDSAAQGTEKRFLFRCSLGRPQGDEFRFGAADPDTSVTIRVICGVNHFPRIDSISINGNTARDNDTVRLIPGLPYPVLAHAFDADAGYWDSLTFVFSRGGNNTVSRDSSFTYIPGRFDTAVKIAAYDLFGIRDSMRFFIKFPWYAKDSIDNPELFAARKNLCAVSQIVGSSECDTVALPIKNAGNDTLSVLSLRFKGSDRRWLTMLVPKDGSLRSYFPADSASIFPLHCLPDSTLRFYALFTSDSLKGDGLVDDTIIIGLNDGRQGFDTLPVRLEHNDLPRIISCSIQFAKDKPYWLAKRIKQSSGNVQQYVFPPYSKLSLTFSEPMDSISALAAIRIYSVFDSSATNAATPLPLIHTWTSGRTRVDLSPRYSQNSPYFGFMPMPGFFIPTDSIRLVVSSSMTDLARTPSGPNGLDVHGLSKRSAPSDTVFPFRIDSVRFTLASISPGSGATDIAPGTSIVLAFSSAPLPGTIDTSLLNNRMLIVRTSYHSASAISYSRISIRGDSIVCVPSKRFFYGDTVICRYRGMWARDSLGYSADISKNGIPLSMFDSTSNQDDRQWFFVVKNIDRAAVFPANRAADAASRTAIRISFSDTVPAAGIDTSLRNNRTLIATSRCSNLSRIDFDSVRLSGRSAVFYPAHALYYGDSVFCSYRGLSTVDTGRYAFDANNGPIFTKDSMQWSFSIKPLRLVSVAPESSSNSSSMHPEIILRFSDPVYGGTFDTDTTNRNRSFRLTSSYSTDSALPYRSITFSADRSQVNLVPKAAFFSNDSLHCSFAGFLSKIAYGPVDNLPGNDPMMCGKEWHFFIRTEGFYTYPNPYKPGNDPRHCGTNGPCGIWFKNLHVLKNGINEVSIKIFTMTAHPLYSTQAAGVRIRYQTGNPQMRPEWKWDTRNQRGSLVASGLYLYAIYDPNGNVIFKGKLMIVR